MERDDGTSLDELDGTGDPDLNVNVEISNMLFNTILIRSSEYR